MKKTILVTYALLVVGMIGCGSNNTSSNNANSCTVGYTWNGTSCVYNGVNNGLNNNGYVNGVYTGNVTNPQGCSVGYIWNGTTCIVGNNAQTIDPNTGLPINNGLPQSQIYPNYQQPQMAQNCGQGTYYNGSACAAVVVQQQGLCQQGQIGTQFYGCVQQASACETRYAYNDGGVSSCMPVAVTPCKSVRRKVRYVYSDSGSSNSDCNGGCATPKKIKYYKDGTVRKIKY